MKYTHIHRVNNRPGFVLEQTDTKIVMQDEYGLRYIVKNSQEQNSHWRLMTEEELHGIRPNENAQRLA